MGFLAKLFGRSGETDDQREERLYYEKSYSGSAACFKISDVFSVSGRGTVVTGTVLDGTFTVGDNVKIQTDSAEYETVIIGIELFRKQTGSVGKGQNAGLLLRGIERKQLHKGDKIIK